MVIEQFRAGSKTPEVETETRVPGAQETVPAHGGAERADFNKWWCGKNEEKNFKPKELETLCGENENLGVCLSKNAFDKLARSWPEQTKTWFEFLKGEKEFSALDKGGRDALAALMLWAERIVQRGAQEHVLQFFESQWRLNLGGQEKYLDSLSLEKIKTGAWKNSRALLDWAANTPREERAKTWELFPQHREE